MLRIEAVGVTSEELADLRARHDIVVQPGYVTTVTARKIDGQIVWSIRRTKDVVRKALGEKPEERLEATVLAA